VAAATVRAAAALGFPVLADPQSGLLAGGHDRALVVAAGYALAQDGVLDRLAPEAVLRVGPPCVSKPLTTWLAAHPGVPQVHVDDEEWRDPHGTVSRAVRADAAATLDAIAAAGTAPAPASWAEAWQEAGRAASGAVRDAVAALPFPTEPGVAAAVAEALPDGSLLYAASSMPIRDVALTFAPTPRSIRIASNRGANGIDGFVSSALGAAAAWDGPVVALAGDLSAVHDIGAFATAARLGLPATFVVIDNDGGGIFHFLPQAGFPEVFERHFGTPQGVDLVALAGALGIPAQRAAGYDDVTEAVAAAPDGPRLLTVETDRSANVEVHRRIAEAVRAANGGPA
jgi:2-succinyl-5-enolpyruvyl-6-hydroxy-3-cyclohexene-1-carboxylate synthase